MTYNSDRIEQDLERLQDTVDETLIEVRRTNSRVSNIEEWQNVVGEWQSHIEVVLYGDKKGGTDGLVQKSGALDQMLHEWRGLKHAFLWFAATAGAAAIGLAVNLAAG